MTEEELLAYEARRLPSAKLKFGLKEGIREGRQKEIEEICR